MIPGGGDVFVFSAFGIHSDNEHMSRSNNDTVSFISVVDMESPVRDNKCSPKQKEPLLPIQIWTEATLQLYLEAMYNGNGIIN